MSGSITIAGLPAASALDGSETVPVVQSGVTKRVVASAISGLVPLATSGVAGLVKVGANLSVAGDGTLSSNGIQESATYDPYWGNVTFVTNFEGTDGGTVFTDYGPLNVQFLTTGSPHTSTANPPSFCSSSLRLDGSSYLNAIACPFDMSGNGLGTLEFWIKLDSYPLENYYNCPFMLDVRENETSFNVQIKNTSWIVGQAKGGALVIHYGSAFPISTWAHIAIVFVNYRRSLLFLNGVLASERVLTRPTSVPTDYGFGIGADTSSFGYGSAPMIGNIGPMRYTAGVARYKSAFTPPNHKFYLG